MIAYPWLQAYAITFIIVVSSPIQRVHTLQRCKNGIRSFPVPNVLGGPFPLPDAPDLPQTSIESSTKTPAPSKTAPNVNTEEVSNETSTEDETRSQQNSGMSVDLMLSIKNTLQSERESITKLTKQIQELQSSLREAKQKLEQETTKAEKLGTPNQFSLTFSFPQRQQIDEVEQPPAASNEDSTDPKEGSSTRTGAQPVSPHVKSLPIPMIYASEDGRAQLAKQLQNVEDVQTAESLFNEKELKNMATAFPKSVKQEIEESQDMLDRLTAATAYLKSDLELTNEQMKPTLHKMF